MGKADHLPPKKRRIDLNLSLGLNSIDPTSKILPEEMELGLGAESSSNNSAHESGNNLQIPANTLNLHPQGLELERPTQEQDVIKNLKSAKFSALLFEIGSWKWVSKGNEDLLAKIYYKSKKLIWEFLIGNI